jgi:Na+-transporting NADH:ubiquinone oxidoreductase subunit NqrF
VFKEMFGGNVKKRSKRANKASRSSYIWAVYGEDAISLIKIILKYLHEKHQQAVILLKIQGYPPHSFMRKHLLNELKKLKRIDYE